MYRFDHLQLCTNKSTAPYRSVCSAPVYGYSYVKCTDIQIMETLMMDDFSMNIYITIIG